MALPVAPYSQPTQLVDANGVQTEGVNKVAIYYWDTSSLAWVKATGGAVPGQNVNVTNFPAVQPVSATSWPLPTGASTEATLSALNAKITTSNTGTVITDPTLAVVTKSVTTGQSIDGTGYKEAKTGPDGSQIFNQNTVVDPANSSTTNLAAGATFTGVGTVDLLYTGVQFQLFADQNCTVYLEQSIDNIHWDVSDPFTVYANQGNGSTVQLVSNYYRTRVTNNGIAATTIFRLITIAIPFINPLPRTLDQLGNLKVGVKSISDVQGHVAYNSPQGEVMTSPLYRLIGSTFSGVAGPDATRWTVVVGTGGTVSESGGFVTMSTGTTANNSVSLTSIEIARYLAGCANKCRVAVTLPDTGVANNTRRGGIFDVNNGAFFQLSGTVFSAVLRKGGVDTLISNGSFNGQGGSTIALDTNSHRWDIVYTIYSVEFYIDGLLLHTFRVTNTQWYTNIHLPVRFENFNSGGSTTNVTMYVTAAVVAREGIPEIQPLYYFISTPGTYIVKNSPGNIESFLMSNIANNANIVVYDNTAGSGTVIWNSGTFGAQTVPFSFSFSGIAFNVGLTIVVTGTINVLIMYS